MKYTNILLLTLIVSVTGITYTMNLNEQLFKAIEKNNLEQVEQLLSQGADVNAKSTRGKTPLHKAAYRGHTQVAKLLLQYNANINAKNVWGWTPLHHAALNGRTQAAELLLQQGADVNAKSTRGWTPLHYAAEYGYTQIAELLLQHGAHVNANKTSCGWTPLHEAAGNGHTQVVERLLQYGANTNAKDNTGWTPLYWAAESGYTKIANLLNNYKQLLNQTQTKPTQPLLTHAIESGYYGLVELLITKNIKPTLDNLELAKQKYNQAQEQWQKNTYARISCLLLKYLSLTQDKGLISKHGIVGTHGLDENIVQIIAQFLN